MAGKDLICPHCRARLTLSDGTLRPKDDARDEEPDIATLWDRPRPPEPARGSGIRKTEDVASGWGFLRQKPAAAAAPAPTPTPPPTATPKPKPRPRPTPTPTATPKPTAKPAPKPTAVQPVPGGPTVMDVLGSDPNLNDGQRETLRLVYQRFAPAVVPSGDRDVAGLTVADALRTDPNINRGQVATLEMIYRRFVPK